MVFGQRSQLWDLLLRDSFRILSAIHRLPTAEATVRTEQLVDRLGLGELLDTPCNGSSRSVSGCEARWRRRWSTAHDSWCWTSPPSVWT